MARCYSKPVPIRQPSLPLVWLVSDARNDATLEHALTRLPRGSGLVFRHYHLPPPARRARFEVFKRRARKRGVRVILSGTPAQARRWGADGAYGSASALAKGPVMTRLVTVHSLHDITRARRADAIVLSPVFPTRSHPGGATLGPARFHLLSALTPVPAIALGGMNQHRARAFGIARWAAIDGLGHPPQCSRSILDGESRQAA